MSITPTYPGVYIEEIPGGVHTIMGVSTSVTAFIGRALKGPVNEPTIVNSYGDYERNFGGLWADSTMSYAVRDFFQNGGTQAIIVRLFKPTYATDAERTAALAAETTKATAAANAVRTAAKGAANDTVAKVVAAARDAADVYKNNPASSQSEKDASAAVAKAVTEASEKKPSLQDIVAAANTAAATFADSGAAGYSAAKKDAAAAVAKAAADMAVQANVTTNDVLKAIDTADETYAASTDERGAADAVKAAAHAAANKMPTVNDVKTAADNAVAPAAAKAAGMAVPFTKAKLTIGGLTLEAVNEGAWGNKLRARADHDTRKEEPGEEGTLFNLYIKDTGTGRIEVHRNLSIKNGHPRQADRVLARESALVRMSGTTLPNAKPAKSDAATAGNDPFAEATSTIVSSTDYASDSLPLQLTDYRGSKDKKTGIYALDKSDLFNLLCIPPDARDGNLPNDVYSDAMAYCVNRRAILIVDPPVEWCGVKEEAAARASAGLATMSLSGTNARNAFIYFPRVMQTDSLRDGQTDVFPACGIMAGVIAKTDAQRGVWNAPAGIEAGLSGIQGLQVNFNDAESGMLNPLGINCLRAFPGSGAVVWGARTLRGDDRLADEYKYISVRRMALYIEESLYRGTHWAVFKPNDEPLWAQLRLNIGSFMQSLFRQGAFKGKTPREAYFVKCDSETTTADDINRGIVNIVVGFAPLKPAEFVIISIQQMAENLQT